MMGAMRLLALLADAKRGQLDDMIAAAIALAMVRDTFFWKGSHGKTPLCDARDTREKTRDASRAPMVTHVVT